MNILCRKHRKNNKGFSLVELIIVIAIMVALVAVMGPQYVKYVQSSRDAVVVNAAQDVLSVVKAEVNFGSLKFANDNTSTTTQKGYVTICAENGNGYLSVTLSDNLVYDGGVEEFQKMCGVDTSKIVKSDLQYKITIEGNNISAHPELVLIEVETTRTGDGE